MFKIPVYVLYGKNVGRAVVVWLRDVAAWACLLRGGWEGWTDAAV